jgi:uncharacterized protein YjbI with pentapeptide repeats
VDLSAAELLDANLSSADLTEADLSLAKLGAAELREAGMSFANLVGVDLRDADLSGVKPNGANLNRANLSGADLRARALPTSITTRTPSSATYAGATRPRAGGDGCVRPLQRSGWRWFGLVVGRVGLEPTAKGL